MLLWPTMTSNSCSSSSSKYSSASLLTNRSRCCSIPWQDQSSECNDWSSSIVVSRVVANQEHCSQASWMWLNSNHQGLNATCLHNQVPSTQGQWNQHEATPHSIIEELLAIEHVLDALAPHSLVSSSTATKSIMQCWWSQSNQTIKWQLFTSTQWLAGLKIPFICTRDVLIEFESIPSDDVSMKLGSSNQKMICLITIRGEVHQTCWSACSFHIDRTSLRLIRIISSVSFDPPAICQYDLTSVSMM